MDVVEGFRQGGAMSTPDAPTLRNASLVNLGRHPETPAAQALVTALVPIIAPHLSRTRAVGRKGLVSLTEDLGAVMGGIMRPGLQGVPVRAQASSSGPMWQGQAMGRDRFWRIAGALQMAALIDKLDGIKTPADFDGYGGRATALWPTEALIELATSVGCTVEGRKADWRADATVKAKARKVSEVALVTCRPAKGVPLALTPEMQDTLDAWRRDLQAVNAVNDGADIRGAGQTVTMVRRFIHSPLLHGRFYAPHVVMAHEDRARITIGGEPTVEVDLKASQLSILLGIMGAREVQGDPYAVDGIPRACVKQFILQTLGAGKPAGGWSKRGGDGAAWPSTRAVWEALKPRYGFLGDLGSLLPPKVFVGLPPDLHGWAVGQHLVQREATIVARALGDLGRGGIAALPVHDSLVVTVGQSETAVRALKDAFVTLEGVQPIVTSP